jgi:hypothetical protein
MYNTDFHVKYHDIEAALLVNFQKMMEKKIAIASGTYVEVPKVKKVKKVLKYVEQCATCVNCATCSKNRSNTSKHNKDKGNATINEAFLCKEITAAAASIIDAPIIVEPIVITGKEKKEKKEKKETKKAKKIREDAEALTKVQAQAEAEAEAAKKKLLEAEKKLLEAKAEDEYYSDSDDSDDEDLEYTLEDVQIICDKLYRDELLSVFNVSSTEDERMDAGLKASIERLIDNKDFRDFMDDVKIQLIDFENFVGNPAEMENMKRNSEYLIFITMFSQKLFYLTHICLCQLFTVNEIDPELLLKVKEKILYLFKS